MAHSNTMAAVVSYPRWTKPSNAQSPVVEYRALLALRRPPASTPPPHPSRPEIPPIPQGYTRSLHAAPAAWPRQMRESKGTNSRESHPHGELNGATKEERNAQIDKVKNTGLNARHAAVEWDIEEAVKGGQPALWLAAERWRRDEQHPDGVTLVMSHANGLPKEHWHPVLRRIIADSEQGNNGSLFGSGAPLPKHANVIINDIWMVDDAHHGASIDLNAGKLPGIYAWADCARDLLNFVEHVLPSATGEYALKWEEDKPGPKVIGMGHSLSGNALVQASCVRPDLFSALFLVEPMTQPALGNVQKKNGNPIVLGAVKRRDNWSSLDEAAKQRTNALFKPWDEDIWALWLSHGMVPSTAGVQLATPSWAEAAVFSDPWAPQRGWDKLPEVSCPVGFLMAGNPMWLGGPKVAAEIPWRAPRSRNERLMEAGHLILQEKPKETAEALWRFMTTLKAGEWDRAEAKL